MTLNKNEDLFFPPPSFVHHFIAICEIDLDWSSSNSEIGVKLVIFTYVTSKFDRWPSKMIGHFSYPTWSFGHQFVAIRNVQIVANFLLTSANWTSDLDWINEHYLCQWKLLLHLILMIWLERNIVKKMWQMGRGTDGQTNRTVHRAAELQHEKQKIYDWHYPMVLIIMSRKYYTDLILG